MVEGGSTIKASDAAVPVLQIVARNTAADSDNKIHDDREARRYGYGGGLVPGVTLYAYLTRLALHVYGAAWLERGTADFSIQRPVYEGEAVRCEGTLQQQGGGTPTLALRLLRGDGLLSAGGVFALADGEPAATAPIPEGPPPAEPLPPLAPGVVPLGVPLAPLPGSMNPALAAAYAGSTDDPTPWYREASPFGGPLVPPGWLAARQAPLQRTNFQFGPSIHTRSVIRHLAPAFADRNYVTTGIIRETFERKGNHYLILDAETRDARGRAVCRIEHTSIFHVRQAAVEC